MLIKIDKLENYINNLLLYSSYNIIIIAQDESYIHGMVNYLLNVSTQTFKVVDISCAENFLSLYRCAEKFIGTAIAVSPEDFENKIAGYLFESLTSYNYETNKVDEEKVRAAIPEIIQRLNAKYLYIDQQTHEELKNK